MPPESSGMETAALASLVHRERRVCSALQKDGAATRNVGNEHQDNELDQEVGE
jgi:hypothetical protein